MTVVPLITMEKGTDLGCWKRGREGERENIWQLELVLVCCFIVVVFNWGVILPPQGTFRNTRRPFWLSQPIVECWPLVDAT